MATYRVQDDFSNPLEMNAVQNASRYSMVPEAQEFIKGCWRLEKGLESMIDHERKVHDREDVMGAVVTPTYSQQYQPSVKSLHQKLKRCRKEKYKKFLDSLQITTGISGKPYSYAQLITYALATSSTQKMTLAQLYKWCMDNFPYFKETPSQGWKNSIRHNLSLNRNFVRVPRPVNEPGKGSYWTLNRARIRHEMKALDWKKNSKGSRSRMIWEDQNGSWSTCDLSSTAVALPVSPVTEIASRPQMKAIQSYFVLCDSVAYSGSPMPVAFQWCDNVVQPKDGSSCLDFSHRYFDKNQDELLYYLLQSQQLNVQPPQKMVSCQDASGLYPLQDLPCVGANRVFF